MSKKRPVNLNLMTIRFPIAAIASILHRVSGFILFLFIPLFLWGFSFSLTEHGFSFLQSGSCSFFIHFIAWFLLSGLIYHLVAGLRHLMMDMGFFENKQTGPFAAWVVIVISVILIILAAGWLL